MLPRALQQPRTLDEHQPLDSSFHSSLPPPIPHFSFRFLFHISSLSFDACHYYPSPIRPVLLSRRSVQDHGTTLALFFLRSLALRRGRKRWPAVLRDVVGSIRCLLSLLSKSGHYGSCSIISRANQRNGSVLLSTGAQGVMGIGFGSSRKGK